MDDPDASHDASTVFLPVSEAASRLGLTPAGLRSRIRRRLVTTRKGNQGQWLVEVPRDPPVRHDALVTHDDDLQTEVDALRRELGEERLARARMEERLAGIERSHNAELGAKGALIGELRAMLADARRPWWRRWTG